MGSPEPASTTDNSTTETPTTGDRDLAFQHSLRSWSADDIGLIEHRSAAAQPRRHMPRSSSTLSCLNAGRNARTVGHGASKYPDGSAYKGQFANGRRNGFGTCLECVRDSHVLGMCLERVRDVLGTRPLP